MDFYWLPAPPPTAGRWVASAKAPMEDLQVIGTIQPSEAPLHLVGFDPGEELLWSASQAGMVYAHLMLSGAPHVAFRTDREMSPAVAVFPHSSGLVTLTYAAAHFISRGGVELAEVRHESLGVLSAGVMCASGRTPAVALCGAGTADGTEGSGPSLALMDLSTAQLTVQLPLEIVPTVARWEGRSGLLVLGGGDGLARVFDVRSGVKAVGAAPLFPRGVIHDLDVQDNSLAASALRAQLGPLGHDEYVFDSNLRTADLRQLSRPGAQLFFAPGMTAPSEVATGAAHRGGQLCALSLSSSGLLVAASDSTGCIDVCAPTEQTQIAVNFSPEPADPLPFLAWGEPPSALGLLPDPPPYADAPLASDWPAKQLGKRGTRYAEPEVLLATIRSLAPKQHVSFGAVPAIYIPNTETRFGGDAEPAETRSVQSMVTKLQLPGGGEGGAPPRFVEALGACFCSESTSRAWHAPSKTYRRCTMRKVMMRTPGVLLLLCDELGGSVMEEWEAAHGEPWLPSAFGLSLPSERQRGVANAAADGGVGGESEGSGLPAEEGGDAATAEPAAEGVDAPAVRALEAGGGVGDGEQEYELRGLMSFTRSTFVHAKEGSGHLTLSFRVPKLDTPPARTAAAGFESAAPSTAAAATPSVGRDSAVAPEYTPEAAAAAWDGAAEWFVWNDFALGPAAEEEVRRAHSLWKRPAIAVYTRRSLAVDLTALPLRPAERMAVAADIAPEYSLLEVPAPAAGSAISAAGFKPSFKPLGLSELPLATGQLVAIDAEFIAVTRRGKRGANVVVKPARLALARVSCVRGQGPHHGEAFVDSYIAQAEPVVDYLTRFSGLRPGDLDPSVSPHHITTMKAAYLKLRQLVDAGCVFVGHGLKKDFEMINMRVPPEQVLDTVELFWAPGKRRISLRFLAFHMCEIHMSNRLHDTHDSIEDARTALQIYDKYVELRAQGQAVLDAAIDELYRVGREMSWEFSL
ncbi:hypothetical protein EMIHUDRAFT_231780 [Emiliania huxleyi CCMP1516]|uniref:Exonuclease domain-containing protein n=2 Tax=Emiliania huxleyi TaxID=2903 RepID=A0A0D3K754_EMIH1|nr:hypothetical protein EMIHUDRAFT_231780 [Emiliania huxleyi CCMP1516]EOD31589.1 hypothetical protein EMIHUDRAFT_231780 [Emiliania huxleyi CCMP1516]|eukprot:XP_005784018.1 hypothetical protein EMIHUDRAFT_231780 [Emiliania huxleyi CCMP1516]